jgi:exosortase/archaeosortase family protein
VALARALENALFRGVHTDSGSGDLACSSVPIAIVADSFRIVGICLLAQFWGPDEAEVFYPYSDWLIFAVSLIMPFILHRLTSYAFGG